MPRPLPPRRVLLAVHAALALAACRGTTEPQERLLTLEVAPARVPCVGALPTECLQVRERAGAPWTLFYAPVEGFAYEPGFRYALRVARRAVPDPPADGASFAYRLVAVLTKTRVGG